MHETATQLHVVQDDFPRLQSWLGALTEAQRFLAAAKTDSGGYDPSQQIAIKPPEHLQAKGFTSTSVSAWSCYPVGMQKAALVASMTILGWASGDANLISANTDERLTKIRDEMFAYSDIANDWSTGHTKDLFEKKLKALRDKAVAHYDGRAVGIKITSKGIPNKETGLRHDAIDQTYPDAPWDKKSSFDELESAIFPMLDWLSRFIELKFSSV